MRYRFCMACGGGVRGGPGEGGGPPPPPRPRAGGPFSGNPIPASVALIVRGEKVLLARRAAEPYQGTWDLPGGFVEAGETPERGLARGGREGAGGGRRAGPLPA